MVDLSLLGKGLGLSVLGGVAFALHPTTGRLLDERRPSAAEAQAAPAATLPRIPPMQQPALAASEYESDFEGMAAEYARANGGISMVEMQQLAEIAAIRDGRAGPGGYGIGTPSLQPRSGYTGMPGHTGMRGYAGISPGASTYADTGAYGLPTLSLRGGARHSSPSDRYDQERYRGVSGTTYRYDLSRPYDQMRYDVDPMAQLRDSMSVDPRVDLDRSMGQYGGGIDRR